MLLEVVVLILLLINWHIRTRLSLLLWLPLLLKFLKLLHEDLRGQATNGLLLLCLVLVVLRFLVLAFEILSIVLLMLSHWQLVLYGHCELASVLLLCLLLQLHLHLLPLE